MAMGNALLEKALKSLGGRDKFDQQYQQYSGSVHFIDKGRKELISKYADNWVAVHNSEVIAYGKKYQDVVKKIKEKKLPMGEVAIKFLSTRRVTTLF